ncbi:hypothetical protein CtCNB1_3875 [Comamonas thiooxydans]|nr:hypothetical protein CtCNB1_3875 [Comamonas thiooxydans]
MAAVGHLTMLCGHALHGPAFSGLPFLFAQGGSCPCSSPRSPRFQRLCQPLPGRGCAT